jgi:hypothetical protein
MLRVRRPAIISRRLLETAYTVPPARRYAQYGMKRMIIPTKMKGTPNRMKAISEL